MNDNPAVSSIRFINASVKILARDELKKECVFQTLLEFPEWFKELKIYPPSLCPLSKLCYGKPKVSISFFKDQKIEGFVPQTIFILFQENKKFSLTSLRKIKKFEKTFLQTIHQFIQILIDLFETRFPQKL